MSEKIRLADAIKKQAATYRAILQAADALESIGSLEQAAEEAKSAYATAIKEADAAKEASKKAKVELKKHQEAGDEIIAKANDQALATLKEAEQKAEAMIAGADAKVAAILAASTEKLEASKAAIAGQVAQLTSKKVALEQDIAALNAAAAVKADEAEDLEKRLAKAKAQIEKLFG